MNFVDVAISGSGDALWAEAEGLRMQGSQAILFKDAERRAPHPRGPP